MIDDYGVWIFFNDFMVVKDDDVYALRLQLHTTIFIIARGVRGKKQSDTPTDTPAAGADVRTPAQQPAKLVCYNGSVTLRFVREEDTWYWGDDRDFPL